MILNVFFGSKEKCKSKNLLPLEHFSGFLGQLVQQIKVQRPFNFIVMKCVKLREVNII